MTTFPLSLNALEALASLIHATPLSKSERETTPILTAIQLTVTPERWTARATDRYAVAEISAPLGDVAHTVEAEGFTLQLLSDDLASMLRIIKPRIARSGHGHAVISFTTPPAAETESYGLIDVSVYGEHVGVVRTVAGNYPPVERLFPTGDYSETHVVAFDPEKLARLNKVLVPSHAAETPSQRKGRPFVLRFTEGATKPIVVTRFGGALGDDETFRALLMPNKEVAR